MSPLRYLFRRMLRSRGFSLMVLISTAMAIGVIVAAYAVTNAILFKSLGVPNAKGLVYYTLGSGDDVRPVFSGLAFDALRMNPATSESMAWRSHEFRLQAFGESQKLSGAYISGNGFAVLGVKAILGRTLNDADDVHGGGRDGWMADIGFSYWKSHFNSDPGVLGRSIVVDDIPIRVIGVLPAEFTGLSLLSPADVVVPRYFQATDHHREDRYNNPNYLDWLVFGRLPQGVSFASASANLKVIEPWFRRTADPEDSMFSSSLFSSTPPGSLLNVHDGRLGANFELETLHNPLFGVDALAIFVFLFCCCNLTILFVARANREAHALAIRVALGANLGDTMRFAMLEAVVLSTLGCFIALPIAWAGGQILSNTFRSIRGFQYFPIITPNVQIWMAATGITLAVACISGAGTSLWQGRKRATINLRDDRNTPNSHSRGWIIGFEICISILLLTVAIVGGLGFRKLSERPSGFGNGQSIVASIQIRSESSTVAIGPKRNEPIDRGESASGNIDKSASADARQNPPVAKLNRILKVVEASPGIQSAAFSNVLPLEGVTTSGAIETLGREGEMRMQKIWPAGVSIGYFSAIGTKILRGRDFREGDLGGSPVCILSNRAATVMFSRDEALGAYLYRNGIQSCSIIGIAEDAHFKSMSEPSEIVVYELRKQQSPNIIVKAKTSAMAMDAVRNAVRDVAPTAVISGLDTIQAHVDDDLRLRKALTLLGGLCAFIAAIILSVGFFGILSLQVSERKRAIGIEIALGASNARICASVAKRLRNPLIVGAVFGSGFAFLAAEELGKIYELSLSFLIVGFGASMILLGLLLVLAAIVPLLQALRVSPVECLASE
jgi:ABC-type antimicrobial peptide transport system permease subunit